MKKIAMMFPSLIMLLFTLISLETRLYLFLRIPEMIAKSLIFNGLFLFFPLAFLLSGIFTALAHGSLLLNLGVSLLTFFVLMLLYLNSSALIYIFFYTGFYLLAYFITSRIMKKTQKKTADLSA